MGVVSKYLLTTNPFEEWRTNGWLEAGAHSTDSSRCSHAAKDTPGGSGRGNRVTHAGAQTEHPPTGVARPGGETGDSNADGPDCLRGAPHHHLRALAEHHDRPPVVVGDAFKFRVGIHRDGMTNGFEHRQITGRVAVGVALGEVQVLPSRQVAHRLDLSRPVAERAGKIAGVDAIEDLADGADAGRHAERLGQWLDELDRRCRDDVGRPAGVPVSIDQCLRFGPNLGNQLRHDLDVERDEILDAHAFDGPEDPVTDARRLAVAGAAVTEGDGAGRVFAELSRWYQSGTPRRHTEHERAGAADERAVEVEEGRARSARQILTDLRQQCFRHRDSPPTPSRTRVAWEPRVDRPRPRLHPCEYARPAPDVTRCGSRRP